MRYLAPKLGICLTILVAWPFAGPGSQVKADCLRIQIQDRVDADSHDSLSATDCLNDTGNAGPAFETSDDGHPGDAPNTVSLLHRLRRLLASLAQQSLPPSRGSTGTGAGSTTLTDGQPAGVFSNHAIPRPLRIESLPIESTLHPPAPFICGLIDPPRFAS